MLPLAIQEAQLLWIIVGLYYSDFWIWRLPESSLLAISLFWLFLGPDSIWPISMLCIYQVVGLLINIVVVFHLGVDPDLYTALVGGMVWWGLSLLSMALAVYSTPHRVEARLWTSKTKQASTTVQVAAPSPPD